MTDNYFSDKKTERQRYENQSSLFLNNSSEKIGYGIESVSYYLRSPYSYYYKQINNNIKSNYKVLEIGSGIGTHTEELLKTKANVYCLDISPASLKVLKKKFTNFNNFQTIVGDIEKLPFNNEEFDAVSVDNSSQIDVADTIDVDGSLINDFVEHMYFVESSNYIRLNNQPQTFIYDSNNKYCLLIGITTEYFPDGTGEGFSPNIGSNTLKIGDNEINFTINTTSAISCVPNPYRAVSGFNENEHMRTITFINVTNKIIDIYQVDNEAYIKRLINNDEDNNTIRWDLRNFDNEEVLSGIYAYRVGTDTTNGGYLNYFTESYFSIIKPDD